MGAMRTRAKLLLAIAALAAIPGRVLAAAGCSTGDLKCFCEKVSRVHVDGGRALSRSLFDRPN